MPKNKKSWIDSLIETASSTPPEGALTADQFAEKSGYSRAQSQRILELEVKAGHLQVEKFKSGRTWKKYYWDA